MQEDTIAAISTPKGEGAIGIIRLSGPKAISIVQGIFRGPKDKPLEEAISHTIHYGHLVSPDDDSLIDEVLVTLMRAPRTYTREDVVEINCHGGALTLQRVLDLVLKQGARLAEPGEFTKRAFMNGRIDLSQAEAVMDLIRAKTHLASNVAISHLKGTLSQAIEEVRDGLVSVLSAIEAAIDFPEDDVEDVDLSQVNGEILNSISILEALIETANSGRILREGLKTAIIGRTNVGKSSLLNLLLREGRAIVTEIPGTTRDVIEEAVNIRGIPLVLVDTAGIRETGEVIERLGIERTLETMDMAELILYVIDASQGITHEDRQILEGIRHREVLMILNKVDLPNITSADYLSHKLEEMELNFPIIEVSAKEGWGLDQLEEAIIQTALGGQNIQRESEMIMMNARQKDILMRAKSRLREAIVAIELNIPADLVALELRGAAYILGEITGATVDDEVIERIFSQFCVGK